MTHIISRRKFFSYSAAIFTGIMVSQDFTQRIFSSNRLENRLVKIFSYNLIAAKAVGHAYLRVAPQESNVGILTEIIFQSGTALMQRLDVLSEKDLIAKLRNIITEDFITENTVQVDGWVLSKTEARLCALCALL